MAKKKEDTLDELALEATPEPRVYELGFHLDPELPQEEVKKVYQGVRDLIAGVGTIIAEGEPVKIPLAYTISRMDTTGRRDFNSASFCWIAYEADGPSHQKISEAARDNTLIIRFLDIRSSVEEAKHSADMQEMFAQMATAANEEEEHDAPVEAVEEAPAAEITPAPVAEEAA